MTESRSTGTAFFFLLFSRLCNAVCFVASQRLQLNNTQQLLITVTPTVHREKKKLLPRSRHASQQQALKAELILQSPRLIKKGKGRYTWDFALSFSCCHNDRNQDGAWRGEVRVRGNMWGPACVELARSGRLCAGRYREKTRHHFFSSHLREAGKTLPHSSSSLIQWRSPLNSFRVGHCPCSKAVARK